MKTFAQFIALDEFALPLIPKKVDMHKALGLPKPKNKKKMKRLSKKKKELKSPFAKPKIPTLKGIVKKAATNFLFPKPEKKEKV